jgi:methyl-accepting chemotaxis protein I, serine sensor receptor
MVNRPLSRLLELAGSMRQGDLSRSIEVVGRNEISHMSARMNIANQNLREMIGEIASASQNVSSAASEQASALEETSASLEEMSSMTRQNAGNAESADRLMVARAASDDRGRPIDEKPDAIHEQNLPIERGDLQDHQDDR